MKQVSLRAWLAAAFLSLQMNVYASEGAEPSDAGLTEGRGYFFGYSFGNMLQQNGNPDVDLGALLEGIKDSLRGVQPTLSPEEQTAIIEMVRTRQAEMEAAALTIQLAWRSSRAT